jgi:hypothetical protein
LAETNLATLLKPKIARAYLAQACDIFVFRVKCSSKYKLRDLSLFRLSSVLAVHGMESLTAMNDG